MLGLENRIQFYLFNVMLKRDVFSLKVISDATCEIIIWFIIYAIQMHNASSRFSSENILSSKTSFWGENFYYNKNTFQQDVFVNWIFFKANFILFSSLLLLTQFQKYHCRKQESKEKKIVWLHMQGWYF